MEWIANNKEWLFSGVLIVIPLAIIGWIFGAKKIKQKQKNGKNSKNYQVAGDATIKEDDKNNEI